MTPAGYVVEYSPDHPNANQEGRMMQHRLVMECVLGRLLDRREQVHHVDHDRGNNHPDNLQVMSPSAHSRLHNSKRDLGVRRVFLDEQQVREALQGTQIHVAAQKLGTSPQTLHEHYGEIVQETRPTLTPANHRSQLDDRSDEVRRLAADPGVSSRKAGKILGCSGDTVLHWCRRRGIEWAGARSGRPRTRQPS